MAQKIKPDEGYLEANKLYVGAERLQQYLPLLYNKKVALVINNTSRINNTPLPDTLISLGINVVKIFAPEHGYSGTLNRGQNFKDTLINNIKIISLFGKKRQPSYDDLKDVDVVVYDIQDVGVRFFTYISTMYEVMNACAKWKKPFIVLDRPNPNGDYIAGPVLKPKFRSFVGMLPIPIVYGLTPGELALMINGEHWLNDSLQCNLTVIKMRHYTHHYKYIPPIKPSPNLPNYLAIRLYPSLALFEATNFSIGRGTLFPFQVIGYPDPKFGKFTFIPHDIKTMQINPIQEGKTCYGIDLRNINPDTVHFSLYYIIKFYRLSNMGAKFFSRPHWFDLLCGTDKVRKQILEGKNAQEIEKSWKKDLINYDSLRRKYLLYP